MKNLDVGPLPVCEDDHLVGMITDRDITVRATAEALPPRLGQVRDVMTPSEKLVGIVSLGDLAVDTGDEKLAGETLGRVSESV